ncbi:neprilysin 2-like protein [Dermatophagoides farinae]|uniref:Neprilysin 2-like protein n=1 Tax=Dermatophagoides farinae TaxID=6954 RepID=A0A9D4SDH1_DERFA|nr:neprilysin 2-like protein [Dermatophagoides farinae]
MSHHSHHHHHQHNLSNKKISNDSGWSKLAHMIANHLTIVALLIMSGVIIVLMILSSMCLAKHSQQDNVCLSHTCVREAAKIIRSLDETVEPCEDFYQFVCGQWLESTIIPEHKPLENKFDELHDILNRQVRDILEEPIMKDDPDFARNMKLFYHSCMNVTELERKGAEPLIDMIEKLGGWPVLDVGFENSDKNNSTKIWNEDNWSLLDIHRKLNELGVVDDMIIPLIITSYDRNNSHNILAIKEPSFGLMSREFMVKEENNTHIRSYFDLMLYSIELLLDDERFRMDMDKISSDNNDNDSDGESKNSTTNEIMKRFAASQHHLDQRHHHHHRRKQVAREFTFEIDDHDKLPEKVIEEMHQVLRFEQSLANSSIKKEDRGNVSQLFNNMTIAQLQKISPNIEWLELINTFVVDKEKPMTLDREIVVIDLSYVKFLNDIIPKTSKRLLANYIVWRVVKSKIGMLDSTWRRLKQTYNSINLGHPKIEPRWMQCVSHAHATFGTALSNVYVKNYFSIKEKTKINEIVWQIRSELNETIAHADWMDTETRKHAMDKLNLMNFRVGFPDELLDDELVSDFYENLTMTDDYFGNVIAVHKFEAESAFQSLDAINSRDDWRKYSEVVDVNAYYFHQENSFILNAGILQDRFFNPDRPNYLNYGSIGEIIGHEITHGFDSIGKQFDKTGQLRNWWLSSTNKHYEERARCMVKQYNQYYFEQIETNVDGEQTKDENIADNIGVTLAYRAYIRAYSTGNDVDGFIGTGNNNNNNHHHMMNIRHDREQSLPGLSNYNPRQLFWISYGLENCEKMTDELLKLTLEVDTHSPGKYRLNGVVSNSEYFANDFYCPPQSSMNPRNKCQVW